MKAHARSVSSLEGFAPPENASFYSSRPLPPPPPPVSSLRHSLRTPPTRTPPRNITRSQSVSGATRPEIPMRRASLRSQSASPRMPYHYANPPQHKPSFPQLLPLTYSHQPAGSHMSLPSAPVSRRCSDQGAGNDACEPVEYVYFGWCPTNGFSPTASTFKTMNDDARASYAISLANPIVEEEEIIVCRDDDASSVPPPLDADCGSMASTRSSAVSPHHTQLTSGAHIESLDVQVADCGIHAEMDAALDSDYEWTEGSTPCNGTKHQHFSDLETADEYHHIARHIAGQKARHSMYESIGRNSSQSSLSRRLSTSAKNIFNRRRSPPSTPSSGVLSEAMFPTREPTPKAAAPPVPRRPSTALGLRSAPRPVPSRSAFDVSDDEGAEEDDSKVKEVIRDLFAPASVGSAPSLRAIPRSVPWQPELASERVRSQSQPPGLLSRTGDQVRGIFSNSARRERRRKQLLGQIVRVIPEEEHAR